MIARRKSKGSTVFLVSLVIGIIVFVALCGIGFNYLLFMRAQAQFAADAMALTMATKMNTADRIGEFNQVQEASRELVFVSRQNLDQCSDANIPDLDILCDQLLQNARSGHSLVEDERKNQISVVGKEVQEAIVAYNCERNKEGDSPFFGLQTFAPEILRVDLGRLAKVNCNVRSLDTIPELASYDTLKFYCDKTSKLYAADINAALPAPESDLEFNFSSLPAYIGKTSAPSRNTNANVFVPYGTVFAEGKIKNVSLKQIPSAVQIHYGMNVILPWDQSKIVPIRLIASGSASGASADSK
jgi:hypothetical protein